MYKTDEQTDRQTDGRTKATLVACPFPTVGGIIIYIGVSTRPPQVSEEFSLWRLKCLECLRYPGTTTAAHMRMLLLAVI